MTGYAGLTHNVHMKEWLQRVIENRARSVSERNLAKQVRQRDLEMDRLTKSFYDERTELVRQVDTLKEQLEARSVENRIQQVEIDKLTAVCARDLERVRSENESPGHASNGLDLSSRMKT